VTDLPQTIAIDGPAASGKSTVARVVANNLDYLFLDTGVMYRAVTLAAIEQGLSPDDEVAISNLAQSIDIEVGGASQDDGRYYDVLIGGRDVTWDIRSRDVDGNVSRISSYGGVRNAMTRMQQEYGRKGSVVMVGRDIGTVVLPKADLKIYLDASVEERARRRQSELATRGQEADYEEILASLKQRDEMDSTRNVAPLLQAKDAVRIDSSDASQDEVIREIMALISSVQ